ncbi:MAG: glycosyltransferase family 2 protein [Candidatus Heimdallarchaeota archaeon]|nr:glycosyltransferase family 2 protein [Candidatus Heimdallarchaeota archaeon]
MVFEKLSQLFNNNPTLYSTLYWIAYIFAMLSVLSVIIALFWYSTIRNKFSSPKAQKKISAVGIVMIIIAILIIIQLLLIVFQEDILYIVTFVILMISLTILGFKTGTNIILSLLYRGKRKRIDYRPLVSMIVPAYNEAKVIEKTINSLLELSYSTKEIIIVDDGSTDNTLKLVKKIARKAPINVISKPNGGKWSALNKGVEEAKGEIIVCIDADTILAKNAIEQLIPYFTDKEIAAVAGNIKVGNRRKIITKLQALEYVMDINLLRRSESTLSKITVVPGPLGAFRKSVLEEVGMYSADTFAEDADLTMTILRAGYKIKYEKKALGYTEAPTTLLDLGKQRYRWYRGQIQVLKKHRKAIVLMPRIFFNEVILSWFSLFIFLWLFVLMLNPLSLFALFRATEVLPVQTNSLLPQQLADESLIQGMLIICIICFFAILVLELFVTMYTILVDVKEKPRLALNLLLYKFFFLNLINIIRVLSQIEELLNYPMKWEIAQRKGSISKS